MPGKGINGRANMQKFQMNSKKYGGNPFNFQALVNCRNRSRAMCNYIQRRAEAKTESVVAPDVDAGIWELFSTLTTTELDTEFGKQVSCNSDGSIIAIMAQDYEEPGLTNAWGKIYIYKLVGGVYTKFQEIIPTLAEERIGRWSDRDQISVSNDGSIIVYNTMNTPDNVGHTIIIKNDGVGGIYQNVQPHIIGPGGLNSGPVFSCVSGDATRVFCSAYNIKEIDIYILDGAAYILEGTITNAVAGIFNFGQSLATNTDGTKAVFGYSQGAYVYQFDGTWTTIIKEIHGLDPASHLGRGVGMDGTGNIFVVSEGRANTGDIHVYKFNPNTTQYDLTTISTIYGGPGAWFLGIQVSKDGNKIICGSSSYDIPATDNGVLFVYKKDGNNWVLDDKSLHGGEDDFFGYDSAISANGNLIIGSTPYWGGDNGYVRIYKMS